MKWVNILFISALSFASCKKSKAPTATEVADSMSGTWKIESYEMEQYAPATHTMNRWELGCRPNASMQFQSPGLYVNFDSVAPMTWTYTFISPRRILLNNKNWDLHWISNQQVNLLLVDRDSFNTEPVTFRLKKP